MEELQLGRRSASLTVTVWSIGWLIVAIALNALLDRDGRPLLEAIGGPDARSAWSGISGAVEGLITSSAREELVKFAVGVGLPSTFATLLSVSLVALGQSGDAAAILEHQWYRLGWQQHVPFLRRGNPLWTAILAIAGTTAAAGGLWLAQASQHRIFVFPLAIVAVAVLAEVVLVIGCVFWALRLRATPLLARALGASAGNVIAHVAEGTHMRVLVEPVLTADRSFRYIEQREFINLFDALEQAVVRSQQNGQTLAACVALKQIRDVHYGYDQATRKQTIPAEWYLIEPPRCQPSAAQLKVPAGDAPPTMAPRRHEDWVTQSVLRAFARALRVAARADDTVCGREILGHLLPVVLQAGQNATIPDRLGFAVGAMDEAILALEDGLLAAAEARGYQLEQELIDNISELLGLDLRRPRAEGVVADDRLRRDLVRIGIGCVEVGAPTALTRIVQRLAPIAGPTTRAALVMAALEVAAYSIQAGRWAAARMLVEWCASVDRKGTACARLTRRLDEDSAPVGAPPVTLQHRAAAIFATLLQADVRAPWPPPIVADIVRRAGAYEGVGARLMAVLPQLTDDASIRIARWRQLWP